MESRIQISSLSRLAGPSSLLRSRRATEDLDLLVIALEVICRLWIYEFLLTMIPTSHYDYRKELFIYSGVYCVGKIVYG